MGRWPRHRPGRSGQAALPLPMESGAPELSDFTAYEKMAGECGVMGIYPQGHLMEVIRPRLGGGVLPTTAVCGLGEGAEVLVPDVRDSRRERLTEVERRLQARTGGSPALYRVARVAPWHPAPEMRAVQTPLDPLSGGIRPLLTPEHIEVQEDECHLPEMLRHGEEWQRIARIEDSWCFDLWWLPNPITRTYYRAEREDGGQVTLFRDQRGGWFRQGR